MDEILITARDVGKKIKKRKKGASLIRPEYEEITILSGVNLTVNKGECIVVIGESGAGKTLLLDILSGKDKEFTGELSLSSSAYINEIVRKLSPRLSGEKNILNILSSFGIKKKEAISFYDKIAVFSELFENLEKPVREYSYGMKMRLVFSAVAFLGAGLIIIDDMPSAFDRVFMRKVTDKIEELRLMGTSFIISDNTVSLPLSLSAKTVSMSGGKMISVGNP
ncbi:MAG: ATP-binding cassette domain-containing protein, partial [Oscillospiraceae bacterium]|nr:ATP-binding cassette domain-containing protein [Oscillospiraceae bacterium]